MFVVLNQGVDFFFFLPALHTFRCSFQPFCCRRRPQASEGRVDVHVVGVVNKEDDEKEDDVKKDDDKEDDNTKERNIQGLNKRKKRQYVCGRVQEKNR